MATPTVKHYMREWRLKRGMRQDDLAARIGTTKSVISRLETGSRGMTVQTLVAIMMALEVTGPQFFCHPDSESLDALASTVDEETRARIVKVVRAMIEQ